MPIRLNYTHNKKIDAIFDIYKYQLNLIYNNTYDKNINYYKEMEISYWKYFFSFWYWGTAIKLEYREKLGIK
jgi:hypothetical protein